ncbi:MAG: hypothetical protein Q4C58_15960 [Eubacteriales bacterium]|nr:hypothetical protein [Eubacteriales bacterium]MDO4334160.1 hypothetical protein [Eubacteriales bacterium]
MSYVKKPLEELDVMDDFLMNQLASDEAVGEAFCRRLLSTLLHREIGKLKVSAQKVLPALSPDLRGIRMDVEVEELSDKPDGQEPAVMNLYDVQHQK